MPNMSYCKFQNTIDAMIDCNESLTDFIENEGDLSDVSEEEREAMEKMHYMAKEMVLAFEELEVAEEEC